MFMPPAPPTDNLYKFLAIFGSWIFVTILAISFFSIYIETQIDNISKSNLELIENNRIISLIDIRLAAIHNNRLDVGAISGVFIDDGSEYEINYLKKLRDEKQKEVEKYTKPTIDYMSIALYAKNSLKEIFFVFLTAISTCAFCLIKGYGGWLRNQKISDETLIVEHEIKRLSLKLLQLELKQKLNNVSDNPPPSIASKFRF